ncbi:MAG TPA: glycosyltransferase family 4 protein [Polyangia bacterium]|nr:glycosyltransferase family 4 protein [Polyangia bacterium]
MSVLVSHPHAAAVSVGVARSLARAGRLAAFATGVAFSESTFVGRLATQVAARRPTLYNRILPEIPAERLRTLPTVELGARAAAAALARLGVHLINPYDALFTSHDAVVARLAWPTETSAIYAYEDGALWTFRRAASEGLERVWDLPSPHYKSIERLWAEEARRWPESIASVPHAEPAWKRRRKDDELALATKVAVASRFTKSSLVGLDVERPVVVVPYGFPVDEFLPRTTRPTSKFTVLAVGRHDPRKGTPYLLEAWRRAAIPNAELHLVGALRLPKPFLDRYAGLFRHWPHVPKAELPARYAAADLLAFPTLGDGFGLVIQEAMCTGTPVVTTPCGGGPECIDDGVDGWIVPPRDVDALVERLRFGAANRDALFETGRRARARAERWTWREAGDAYVRALA